MKKLCLLLLMLSLLSPMTASVSTGGLFSSGTVTANGDSGWKKVPTNHKRNAGWDTARCTLVPANLAGSETLDVTVDFGYTLAGAGFETRFVFAQVTSTNDAETQVVTNKLPGFFRVNWVVGGAGPSMDFVFYCVGVSP